MKWILGSVLAGTLCALSGCSSMLTNGEVTHFVVDDAGALRGPWYATDQRERAIAASDDGADRENVFQLAFDTSFVRYLPDFGGVNEVIVVFRFRDGPATADGKGEIVKIVGPMRRQPDGALLPQVSRVSYGPTSLKSEYLHVSVQVVEYDRDESDDTSAFMDFVGNAAESLSLADPVSSAEIRVAKEIAKTIAASNENDVMLDASFDLIPFDGDVWTHNPRASHTALPLRTGTFGLVKSEIPAPMFTFFPFTTNLTFTGGEDLFCVPAGLVGDVLALPFALVFDVVHLPFAGAMRAFGDAPERASMTKLRHDGNRLTDDGLLELDRASRHLTRGGEIYRDKTWMLFSVSRGHDALPNDAVDNLTEAEQKIVARLGRRTLKERLEGNLVQDAIDDLVAAKESVEKARRLGRYSLARRHVELPAGGLTALVVEIRKPSGADVKSPKLIAKDTSAGAPATTDSEKAATSTVVAWEFDAGGAHHVPGDYTVRFTHDPDGDDAKIVSLPLTLVAELQLAKHTDLNGVAAATPWKPGEKKGVLTASNGDFAEVTRVKLSYTSGGESKTWVVDRGDDGATFDSATITLENTTGVEIQSVGTVEVERRGELPSKSI